jgi:hypothetical protein
MTAFLGRLAAYSRIFSFYPGSLCGSTPSFVISQTLKPMAMTAMEKEHVDMPVDQAGIGVLSAQ